MTARQKATHDVLASYEDVLEDSDIILVDTRTAAEYKKGHIPKAINLPLAAIQSAATDKDLADVFGSVGIADDTRCIFYDDIFGAVAARVCMALESLGGDGRLLDVMYSMWLSKYGPENTPATDITQATARVFDIKKDNPNRNILADMDAVQSSSGVILDCRERLNFLSGHIPGAVNMPYTMFRDDSEILKSSDDLQRIFGNRGLDADKPIDIITYCGSAGTLSGLVYYALRYAGFTKIKMYANSFREWNDNKKDVEIQQDANYWDLEG